MLFRRQSGYAGSLYAELLRHGLTASFPRFVAEILGRARFVLHGDWCFHFDYMAFTARWARAARGTLHVRAFTRQQPGSRLIEAVPRCHRCACRSRAEHRGGSQDAQCRHHRAHDTVPPARGPAHRRTICSVQCPAASPVRGRPPMRLIPPDPLRRARLAIGVVFLVNGAVFGSWAPHIPLVQERLGLGPALLGAALLAAAVGALVAMLAAGALIARFGSAPVTRASGLLLCAALPLGALAPSLASLVAALALLGAANGVMDVAMNAHGVAVETRLQQPIMSSLHGMFSLGGLLGAGAGALLLGLAAAGVPTSWWPRWCCWRRP